MTNVALRLLGTVIRNVFITFLSIFCCRCRHRVLRILGLDKSASDQPLEGICVQSSSNFGQWQNWEPALPPPKNKQLLAKQQSAKQQEEAEPEPDYFSELEMAPKVSKAPLIVKKSREPARPNTSKLALQEDYVPQLKSELTDWEDPSAGQGQSGEGWQTVDVLSSNAQNNPSSHYHHHHHKHPSRSKGRPR